MDRDYIILFGRYLLVPEYRTTIYFAISKDEQFRVWTLDVQIVVSLMV
jgi:hypothetical protein